MAIHGLARSLVAAGMIAGAGIVASPGAAFAAGGYTPTPPAPGSTGAFAVIVTVQTVPASGGTVTAVVDGATTIVTVPAGDFTAPVQVVVLAGDLTALTNTGINGTPFLAFGTQIDQDGVKLAGPFAKPIGLKVEDSHITPSTLTYEQSGASFVVASGFTASTGVDDGGFSVDPNFVLANPLTAAPTASNGITTSGGTFSSGGGTTPTGSSISGATIPVTGKPFLGEGLLAFGLIGIGGLGTWRWRRARSAA